MDQYFKIFQDYFLVLPKRFKKKFLVLSFFFFLISLLEFVSIFSLIPILESFTDTNKFTKKLDFLHTYTNSENSLYILFAIFFSIFAFKSLINLIFNYFKFKFIADLKYYLSDQLVKKYLSYDLSLFEKQKSAVLIRNSESETSIFSNSVTDGVIQILNNILIIISLCLLVIIIEPKAFLFSVFVFGLCFFIYYFFTNKRLNEYGNIRVATEKNRIKSIQEIFRNFKEIKIFNKIKYFHNYYAGELKKTARIDFSFLFISSSSKPIIEFLAIFALIIFVLINLLSANNYSEILVELSILAACSFKILPSANAIIVHWISIKFYHPNLLILKKELNENFYFNPNKSLNLFKKNMELKNIKFAHDEKNLILNNLNLKIEKNDILGICGETGSGKSTLVDIICGFRYPNSGSIFFDENNVNLAGTHLLNTSYVSQNISLIEGSIKENIAFGVNKEKIDDSMIIQSLKDAKIYDFVNQLPDKLNSNLFELASNLSGGQKQRFSIARAYYFAADIIIMDEPTSALDPRTIKDLIDILKNKGKTVIIISHDEHTLDICNKIFKIEKKSLKQLK